MKISVEVSYYPLNDDYLTPIKGFIDRINQNKNLVIETNGMSTQVFGDYEEVFGTLQKEIKAAFELPHSVFIMKVINSDLQKIPS
jgi:uncharacterized protein YqgV (UPF0045/DUF77 family)